MLPSEVFDVLSSHLALENRPAFSLRMKWWRTNQYATSCFTP